MIRFKPDKDLWMSAICWIGMLIVIACSSYALIAVTYKFWQFIILVLLGFVIPILIFWTWTSAYYEVGKRHLVIQYGPFTTRIPLADIHSIRKTNNPISSSVPPLKRMEIQYNDFESVSISPKDTEEFMNHIEEYCPHIMLK
ncbi:PH domain-containing protein [Niallia taxi]|uniref:PH domain-containing protein n=1 Tax=Niallia taxi TaxID=2499688 RepID=UPI002E20C0A1|nr:PH domain-containing protein [Niallia taxi]MED4122283.1 PH domain-containing protein [Niallia taxi]